MSKIYYHKIFTNLCCAQAGSVMILWAITLSATLGMIGLGVETGNWYLTKRNLQSASDTAAIAAAYENNSSSRTASANSEMTRNNFGSSAGVTITVNNPPLSGGYTGNSNAVEIIASQVQPKMFSAVLMSQIPTITVRSVAIRNTAGTACVLALNSLSADTLVTSGSATVTMPNCMLAANSSNNGAISINGNSSVTVQGLYTPGGYSVNGSANLTSTTTPVTDGTPLNDPYASLAIPSYSGCNYNNFSTNDTITINPGTYCSGFKLNAHANVTMNPGVYIMDRGSFDINGQATLTGTGVTIILTSSTGAGHAQVTVNGGAVVNLTAPSSGTYKGVSFYQDRNASLENVNNFNGGATMNINGSMYMPRGYMSFNGGSTVSAPCTQIVAYTVKFSGNNSIGSNCSSSNVTPITVPSTVTLEE